MKKFLFLLICLCSFVICHSDAQEANLRKTIHVEKAGTLKDLISEEEIYTIEELTLTGQINALDFRILRQMAGGVFMDYEEKDLKRGDDRGKLAVLDISGTKIVTENENYNNTYLVLLDYYGIDKPFSGVLKENDIIPYYVFSYCKRLHKVILPQGITTIEYSAFEGCSSLTSITIPGSVTSIGKNAFAGCDLSEVISMIENPFDIEDNTFSDNTYKKAKLTVPTGSIDKYKATAGWKNFFIEDGKDDVRKFESGGITYNINDNGTTVTVTAGYTKYKGSITIPSAVSHNGKNYDVTSIGWGAFSNCTGLTSISLGSVMYIQSNAFEGCSGLFSITLPQSLIFIGQYAFAGCSSLAKILSEIESPFELEGSAFDNSTYKYATLSVPIGSKAAYQAKGGWMNFKRIVEVNVPSYDIAVENADGVTIYYNYINEGKELMVTYNPDALVVYDGIEDSYTINNSYKGKVVIPKEVIYMNKTLKVTSISDYVFDSCSDLTFVSVPASVKSIGIKCFYDCKNLKDLYCYAENPPSLYIDEYCFDDGLLENGTLHVPSSAIEIYKSTWMWKDFVNIVAIEENGSSKYKLTYTVDGEVYKSYEVEYGATITPEAEPKKEGYTFSGWSDIPKTMPDHDVTVTGSFSINKYTLTYMIDDLVYKTVEYEYGETIIPEPQPAGDYDIFEWEDLPATMPAHDVTVYASYISAIAEIIMTQGTHRIYAIDGKLRAELQKGLNIVRMSDGTTKIIIIH